MEKQIIEIHENKTSKQSLEMTAYLNGEIISAGKVLSVPESFNNLKELSYNVCFGNSLTPKESYASATEFLHNQIFDEVNNYTLKTEKNLKIIDKTYQQNRTK